MSITGGAATVGTAIGGAVSLVGGASTLGGNVEVQAGNGATTTMTTVAGTSYVSVTSTGVVSLTAATNMVLQSPDTSVSAPIVSVLVRFDAHVAES